MTTDEFINQQNEKIKAIIKDNKPLLFAVRSVMALQSNRIFTKGLNKNGSVIGTYKGGEIYVSLEDSPVKFTPKGKPQNGKTPRDRNAIDINTRKKVKIKSNNEARKTGYFPNYLAYKKTIGKNKTVQSVDLKLSNELNRSWSNGKVNNPQATKINANHYVVELSQNNINKVERYGVGDVFGLSKNEKDSFMKVLQAELVKALK